MRCFLIIIACLACRRLWNNAITTFTVQGKTLQELYVDGVFVSTNAVLTLTTRLGLIEI